MLEIIALVFLTGKMGQLAEQKGQKKGRWKLYTVLAWFGAEFLGILLSILFFKTDDIVMMLPLGYGMAIGSYFLLRSMLQKMPDADQGFEFEQSIRSDNIVSQ